MSQMYIAETIRRRVSLVVTAIDDFTGKTIFGSNARVYIEGEKPPIRKADGFFVFMGLAAGTYTVRAEGGMYREASMECKLSDEDDYLYMKIRLTPDRNYRIPMDTTCVEGLSEPWARIKLYCTDKSAACKLLFELPKGSETAGIYHPALPDISGKALMVMSGNKAEAIRVIASDREDPARYRLEHGTENGYPKIGTVIFPIYETTADEKGRFFLPFPGAVKEKNTYVLEAHGKDTVRTELSLPTGMRSKADLRRT